VTGSAIAVVGAGWAGATAARLLHDAGYKAALFERDRVLGGHSRSEMINGVMYEPNGPHIFHTSNKEVVQFVQAHGMRSTNEHYVLTEIFLDDDDETPVILSWPPQLDELRELRIWSQVERELGERPAEPARDNLEAYCLSIMGPTLYRLFIQDYSRKQWGRDPTDLSYAFGPKRLGLRTDGKRRYFTDPWEFFPPAGAQEIIENIVRPIPVTMGANLTIADLQELEDDYQAVVITAALDDFAGRPGELEWRGVHTVSRYIPLEDQKATVTPAYVVNRPSRRRPYTRTVETKHATRQPAPGTIVSEEYPGSPARHYPVPTADSRNEQHNLLLQDEIRQASPIPVFFCGRLANYVYINQDEAIAQGMACAAAVSALIDRNTR
jgi:UDP-galactopyranose mutase